MGGVARLSRVSRSGFRSMIDSDLAQPTAERSTRKRPETTDTPAPASRHRAIVTRTTAGRRVAARRSAIGSALSALTFDRTPVQVDGHQSCWAANHRSSSSPTVRNGAARRIDRYSANTARPTPDAAPRRPSMLCETRTTAGRSGRTQGRHPPRHGSRTRQGASPAAFLCPRAPIGRKIGSQIMGHRWIPTSAGRHVQASDPGQRLEFRVRSEGFEPPTF